MTKEIEKLKLLEDAVLENLPEPEAKNIERFYVEILPGENIWTWKLENKNSKDPPIVLVHGMAGACGIFVFNIFALAEKLGRTVYVIDLLGFGLSDRVKLGKTVEAVEEKWINSIELWRQKMTIEKMTLLGHSMGGYLTGVYMMKYPNHLEAAFFADPWGFPILDEKKFQERKAERMATMPLWKRGMFKVLFAIDSSIKLNPLSIFRGLGRFGIPFMKKARPDLYERMGQALFDYVGECNKRNPTGEAGFNILHEKFGFACKPMAERICEAGVKVPQHFMFGSRSWIDSASADTILTKFPALTTRTMIPGAGHHIYADNPKEFNETVLARL